MSSDDTISHTSHTELPVIRQSVLESVNGSPDAAIDVLLGMSDPSYVSTQHTAAPESNAANPSLELDEQLARQLMLEDERQQPQSGQGRWRASGQNWPRRGSNAQVSEFHFLDNVFIVTPVSSSERPGKSRRVI